MIRTGDAKHTASQRELAGRKGSARPLHLAMTRLAPMIGLFAFFSVFANILRLTIPLYLLQVVDRVISSGSVDTLIYITMVAVGALTVAAIVGMVMKSVQVRAGAWFEERLAGPVSRAALMGALHNRSHGVRSLADLSQLRAFLSGPMAGTIFEFPWTPVFLLIIFALHPWLGFFASSAAAVLLLLALVNDWAVARVQKRAQDQQRRSRSQLGGVHADAEAVAAMGMTGRVVERVRQMTVEFLVSQGKADERNGFFSNLTRLVRSLAQIGILGLGAYLILDNEITTGTMIAASILQSLGLSPVDKAVGAVRAAKGAREAYGRVAQQLRAVDVREDAANLEKSEGISLRAQAAMYMPRGRGQPVLRPLSFELDAGQTLGILGSTASGKSTLCRLLVGVTSPNNGSILVNGLEVSRLSSDGFGRLVGYLPQNPRPLPGTIAENIARYSDADDAGRSAAVARAASLAGIEDTILSLPDRYDTMLDEDGRRRLTASQMQRIMLARALYGEPRLLVLDEPATFLDKAGESQLMDTLTTLRESGVTVVAVSQRPAFLQSCDRLLWLADGMLGDFGEPEAVLQSISRGGGRGNPRLVSSAGGQGAVRATPRSRAANPPANGDTTVEVETASVPVPVPEDHKLTHSGKRPRRKTGL